MEFGVATLAVLGITNGTARLVTVGTLQDMVRVRTASKSKFAALGRRIE
jgi:hypothetical protein